MRPNPDLAAAISSTPDGIHLRVKVVPGASRTKVAGLLGDRLKLAVAAPPEGGKANRAVCELIAEVMNVPVRDVTVIAGHGEPRKTLEIMGISACAAAERLTSAGKPAG